jgi:hypothetical protein
MPPRYGKPPADVSGRRAKIVKDLSCRARPRNPSEGRPPPPPEREALHLLKGRKEHSPREIPKTTTPRNPPHFCSFCAFLRPSLINPVDDPAKFDYSSPPHIENGGVAKWEGRGLQNLYEWVRLPPPPRPKNWAGVEIHWIGGCGRRTMVSRFSINPRQLPEKLVSVCPRFFPHRTFPRDRL